MRIEEEEGVKKGTKHQHLKYFVEYWSVDCGLWTIPVRTLHCYQDGFKEEAKNN
jgi:hypothetical protein